MRDLQDIRKDIFPIKYLVEVSIPASNGNLDGDVCAITDARDVGGGEVQRNAKFAWRACSSPVSGILYSISAVERIKCIGVLLRRNRDGG